LILSKHILLVYIIFSILISISYHCYYYYYYRYYVLFDVLLMVFLFMFFLRLYFFFFLLLTCMLSVFFPFVFVFPLPCPTPGDLLAGLSKFAKLARSVTRSKTLVSQFSSHPVSIKDSTRHVQSHLAHVSTTGFYCLFNILI